MLVSGLAGQPDLLLLCFFQSFRLLTSFDFLGNIVSVFNELRVQRNDLLTNVNVFRNLNVLGSLTLNRTCLLVPTLVSLLPANVSLFVCHLQRTRTCSR